MTLAERIAAELHRVSTDRYMFGLFGDGRMGSGGFGKLQILGKTKHVTRCQNCGRAGLKHAVVCAVVGEDGHPTNQYYYFGTDCAARLAGKPEKDVEAEAEHQESSGRPRMKNLKPAKPNDGQMELGLRFAAYLHDLMTERYARAKASKGQMGFDFDSLASAPQAPAPAAAPAKPAVSEPPALPVKGKQMGLFDQPEQPKTVASGNATNWDAMSLADKLAWQKSNGKTRPDGTAAPAITKPQATPKVNLSGAVYEFVGHNENGTIRVRNDQGDEFDSEPGEQWKQHGEYPVPSSPAKAGGWNEEKHPRWEAGDKQHHGGQFSPKESKQQSHKAIYNGKEIDADDFKQAANRVHVNLKSGEHGYVRTPEGKLFEIAADKKMAVPVDAMRSKEQRDISLMEERVGKAQSPQEKAVLSKRLDEMKAAVAPKESKSELAIDNPPFRDFRYVPKHRNAGSLYPNRPGQLFTDEQQQQLKNWARQNGMMVSSDSGPGAIHVVHNDHRSRLDLTLHGAEGVKREAAAVKSKQAAEQESARKQQADADLAGRAAAGFINEAFGDSLNTYNKTKLADFLEGKDKKFGGLWSPLHADALQKLGAVDSSGRVNLDEIRKAFEQHGKAATASGPQEPAKPDLHAIAAEARANGENLWVTAKRHGIGITHPQASELAKVFLAMGEAEKPQAGAGQLRGQAKFNETRAQEAPKAAEPAAPSQPAAPKQDDFEGLVDTPAETTKPSGERPTFGDLVKAPDGTVGIMRGDNGLGGNRAGLIDQDGNRSWQNRDELQAASEADLPEGKTLADMPTQMRQPGAPQEPAKPEPEAPKSAGSDIEYRVRHDLPPKERIARYLRAHLKPGDEISVGGNGTLKIKRINAKSVTTETGGTWEYGSFKPVGLDLSGMSEKLEQFEKMGGLEAHFLRSTTAKAIKSAVLKSDSDPLAKTLTEEGLKQVREAKTAHLGFVAEQLAGLMPGMDRAAIRQAILNHRKAAGIVEDEAGESKGPIQIAVKSQVPTVDEIEHALQHIEPNQTGTRFIERNPDTGEVRWAHHENKNAAVNNFINRQRSKLAPNDYVRVRGNYKSWLKSHGTDENKLLGVDPKAAKAKQQEAMSKASMTLADFAKHMNDLDDGKVSADEHKAAFARFRDSLPGLEAEISKMKKEDIEGWTHEPGMRILGRSASKKAEAVQDLLRRMKSSFDVRGETNRWTYGQDREKQLHDAVAGITDDHIKEYTEGVAQVRAERAERQKKREESLANPQTFDDWKRKAILSGGWEKLSPEHQAAYDESYAQHRREKFPSKLEKPREVSAFAGGQEKTGEVGIVKGHHQKRNAPTWTVTVQEHLGDSWKEALSRAKQLGGNYVNARIARAYGATPGFQFFDEEAAKKFHAVLGGQSVDNSDKIEARAAERAENVAGKLADLSERLAERGEDSLNRDRKDNTARRARMASSAEDDARKQLAKAKTLAKVADHITSGKAVHLKHVSNGAQVDQLDKLLYRSQINAIQKRQRAGERVSEDDWERPASLEDITHAEYPYPYLHKSELRDQAAALAGVPGLKMFAAKLGKMAAEMPYDKDYAQIKDLGDLEKIQEAIPKMRRHSDHNVRRIASRFAEKLEDMNRLQRMDIRSTPELRAALREYHTMKQEPEGRDPLKEHLRYLKRQKIDGFFPTPPPLIEKMLDHADIGEGMSVLEPSAGIGSIMAAIRDNHPDAELHGIEQDRDIAKALELQGLPHERGDFLQHDKKYDRIVMNPPFENRQDEKHVKHAYNLLKPGGRLVAIMGAGAHQNERSAGFRDWLSLMGGKVYDTPEGSFAGDDAFRQTGVRTKMVIIDKPVEETERHSLADEARELSQRVQRIVERYSAAHGFEDLLARAEKYRVKGQSYNRNIHTSASRLDDMLSQGRHKEAAHWADELRLRLDALEPKPATDLLGQPVKPAPKPKAVFDSSKGKQQTLFAGLNAKEGQMNLFADAGVPDDLVAKPQQPAQKELFSAIRDALVERYDQSGDRQPKFRIDAGMKAAAQQTPPSTKPPAIFGAIGGLASKAGNWLQDKADKVAGKIGGAAQKLDQKGQAAMAKVGLADKVAAPAKPKSSGVKAGAPLMFNGDHSINGGQTSIPKGTQGKLVGPHQDPKNVVVDVGGQHHVVPKSLLLHDLRHTDHKAVEKSKQEAQQAQADQQAKVRQMTARQRAEAVPDGAGKAKLKNMNIGSHELQVGDIVNHSTPGLHAYGRVLEVSPDGKKIKIEEAARSKGSPGGIATTGRHVWIDGHEKIGDTGAVGTRSFPVLRTPDEYRPIGERKEYKEAYEGAKKLGLNDDQAHEMAMQMWDDLQAKNNPKPQPAPAAQQPAQAQPQAAQAKPAGSPKPRHHAESLQAGDTLRMLKGSDTGTNLKFIGRSKQPGMVEVEHPTLGRQTFRSRDLGLYVPGSPKAAGPSFTDQMKKGYDRSSPDMHTVKRSEFAGQKHGVLAKDQQGRGFLLYGGKKFALQPNEFDGQKLIGDNAGVKIRERIHREQIQALASKVPSAVPAHVREEYDHHWDKWTGDSPFAKSGGKPAKGPAQVPQEPKRAATLIGMPLNTPAGKAGVGRLTPVEQRSPLEDPALQEQIQERAAIMEHEGGYDPQSALRLAIRDAARRFKPSQPLPQVSADAQPARADSRIQPGQKASNPARLEGQKAALNRSLLEDAGQAQQPKAIFLGRDQFRNALQSPPSRVRTGTPAQPPAPIDEEAAERAAIQAEGNQITPEGQAASPPPTQPAGAASAPSGVNPPAAKPQSPNLRALIRPFQAGRNMAVMQFADELQRDLHDYAAAQGRRRQFSGKAGRQQPRQAAQLESTLNRIAAEHFGGDKDAAHLAALQTLQHVKAHMRGVGDGQHKIIPPTSAGLPAEPQQPATATATNTGRLTKLPQNPTPRQAEQHVNTMVNRHMREFAAREAAQVQKLVNAWKVYREKMGVPANRTFKGARDLKKALAQGADSQGVGLKNFDVWADQLHKDFPWAFSDRDGSKDESAIFDFFASDPPAIPKASDSELQDKFWAAVTPEYKKHLEMMRMGEVPLEHLDLSQQMGDDMRDWEAHRRANDNFSAFQDALVERFSVFWQSSGGMNGRQAGKQRNPSLTV